MKLQYWFCLTLVALFTLVAAAQLVTPGLPTSRYPNISTADPTDLINIARTNTTIGLGVRTNHNMLMRDVFAQASNGLATVTLVTTTSNGLFNIITLSSNGLVTYVTVTSNSLFNSLLNVSNFLATSSIDVKTNQTMMVLQDTPVKGSQWYVGTNGTPTTNEARSGLEFNAFWRSLRMGEVAGGDDPISYIGRGSNYWNNTNIGPCTVGFGSNAFAKAAYSSVLGGSFNAIGTNAKFSVIGGGQDNLIITNSHTSVISGGGKNHIRPEAAASADIGNSTIGGGSNNVIAGTATAYSTIGGGGDNSISSAREATVAGGFGNSIRLDGRYAFIGGGINNVVGDNATSLEAQAAFLGGGSANITRGQYSVVVGGQNNSQLARDNDYSAIVGGQGNNIGIAAGELESKYAFIGGGDANTISSDCTYGVVVGGAANSVSAGSTNAFIGGGRFNAIGANKVFASILGGERHTVSGNYSFSLGGASNSVTADRAGALGMNVTNVTAGSVTVGELISYNTPAVISGAGSGSTNYTLQLTSPEMVLGSSNVNIVAAMGWIDGKVHKHSVSITNLSADTWGFSFSSVSNRVKWQSWMYGTNVPVVLTNNTLLRIDFTWTGTNGLAEYKYFSPAL